MQSAGGGGYGDPLARDPEAVAEDVRAGHVSHKTAETDYGVIFDETGTVDADATQTLRNTRAEARHTLTVEVDEQPPYTGIKGKQRRLRIAPATADRFGLADGDLIELAGRNAAPLRAWVTLDGAVTPGAAPLDVFARRVLGANAGDAVILRILATLVRPGERT